MSTNLENFYNRKFDNAGGLPPRDQEEIKEFATKAERVVVDFLNAKLKDKGMWARMATKEEDSGDFGHRGKQADAIVYFSEKVNGKENPAMGIQITIAQSRDVQREKIRQLKEKPFIRLDEMDLGTFPVPIPKVVVGMDPTEVESFLKDRDFSKHPKIWKEILTGITHSLIFILNTVINNMKEEEKKVYKPKIENLFLVFGSERETLH